MESREVGKVQMEPEAVEIIFKGTCLSAGDNRDFSLCAERKIRTSGNAELDRDRLAETVEKNAYFGIGESLDAHFQGEQVDCRRNWISGGDQRPEPVRRLVPARTDHSGRDRRNFLSCC